MEHDLRKIHGSNVTREGMILFDKGLVNGDRLMFPQLYQLYFKGQTRSDFYRELQQIQGYTCSTDYSNAD